MYSFFLCTVKKLIDKFGNFLPNFDNFDKKICKFGGELTTLLVFCSKFLKFYKIYYIFLKYAKSDIFFKKFNILTANCKKKALNLKFFGKFGYFCQKLKFC